jgi:glycosyltransferase involved in cell wall biosynthesis
VTAPADAAPRVLHVCTRFGTGGSERRLIDAVAATPDLRHVVAIGRESDGERARTLLPGAEVVEVRSLQRAPHPEADGRAYREIRALITPGTVLVHTHQSKAGALGRIAAARAGVPAVHSLSMANFGPGFGRATSVGYRLVERALASRTAAYAVVGDDLARRFQGLGIPADRFTVVRSSIDIERFRAAPPRAEARERLGAGPEPLMAFVGRLEPTKGSRELAPLLEAVRRRADADVHLVVAGAGPDRAEVEAAFRLAGLVDATTVLGFTDEVPEVLAAADVVVLPSSCEGLPQVLVQAAIVGTPFVAYAADGASELVSAGAVGDVVPIGAVQDAAQAIVSRLAAPDGPGPARPFDASEWHGEVVAAAYRRLYARVLEPAAPGPLVPATEGAP